MKAAHAILLALVCCAPLAASAQWQWVDKNGHRVFSDQAPPPDVTPDRIVKRPGGARGAAIESPVASTAPSAAAAAAAKPTGKDAALEQKKRDADAADAAKKKEAEQKQAVARAENCQRARAAKATFDSGMRIAQINASGEKEYLSDEQRSAEAQRLDGVIARDCRADRQ